MSERVTQDGASCEAGCPQCAQDDGRANPAAISGVPLALLSAVFFLGPLAVAMAGAIALPRLWPHEASPLVGGVAGIVMGVAGSVYLVRRIHGAGEKRRA